MLDLSPTKLLIILVVAVLLLGPKRLPTFARQLGAGWRRLREVHTRLDSEVRQAIPDLPSGQQLARFARSPMTLLDRLADLPADGASTPAPSANGAPADPAPQDTRAAGAVVVPDDPSLN